MMPQPKNGAGAPLSFTLAHSPQGLRLCKTRHPDGTERSYDDAKHFNLAPACFADLHGLEALLRDLAARPDTCVLRGAIADRNRVHGVRRLLHPDRVTGALPTIAPALRAWVATDHDSLHAPPGLDLHDLRACAETARATLPGAFRVAGCIFAATAGHTFKAGIRMRGWFLLERPLSSADVRRWLAGVSIDHSTLRDAQPIYTAAPRFIGAADPLPDRFIRLPGRARVPVPPPDALAPPSPLPKPRAAPGNMNSQYAATRFAALLREAARGDGERHPRILWAACRVGEMIAAGELGRGLATQALIDAAELSGSANATKTVVDGISIGEGA
ncbi:hypothetical protein D9599_05815 [Roseomonas sp. KE2513]|uniref:hypothetical protein n=1 Tax=Roseomonas sp. KE2513 TaxID=2479202 RepID=UPI001E435C4F|nr:hypothetical protein [Roseomonas sp. KE2513]MBI0535089.1 hypothetical protein [Roseomonas sp. KE2513]